MDYKKYAFDRVHQIPLSGAQEPTDEQAETFLRFVQDPSNWPVHRRCSAGKDRTRMMTALVRYGINGWSLNKALGESRSYRSGKDLPEIRLAWLESWAKKHKPGSYRLSSCNLPKPSQGGTDEVSSFWGAWFWAEAPCRELLAPRVVHGPCKESWRGCRVVFEPLSILEANTPGPLQGEIKVNA